MSFFETEYMKLRGDSRAFRYSIQKFQIHFHENYRSNIEKTNLNSNPMNYFLLIAGLLIVFWTLYEIGITTLTSQGAGFVTDKITRAGKGLFMLLSGHNGTKGIVNYTGMFSMVMVIVSWILLLWAGHSLIFCSVEDSVVDQITEEVASINQKVYYVGKTFSVLGTGDYKPNGDFWRIYSAALAFSGLVLITMSITYLLPVLSGDNMQRKLSKSISFLGDSPDDIVANAWTGHDFTNYKLEFSMLSDQILEHSENLESYPILHCFQNSNLSEEDAINIVVLDEALSIMLHAGTISLTDQDKTLLNLRKAITAYLKTNYAYMKESLKEAPSLPDLKHPALEKAPLLQDRGKIAENYEAITKRRRILHSLLAGNGLRWDDINKARFDANRF